MKEHIHRLKRSVSREEIKEKITLLRAQSHNEYKDTLVMFRLLNKRARTKRQKAFIRQQAADIAKISVVLVIAALPAGTVFVAFIEVGFRKINRTILPTSFSKEFKELHNTNQEK